ncbi:MAG: hypothetical protein L3J24_11495 [Xanthomonadales bacterium]|nr:hypothetical protein [Xanthomonadales bacterium]
MINFLVLIVILALSVVAKAEEIDFSASVGVEFREFFQSPRFETQATDINTSLVLEAELKWRSDDRSQRFSIVGFSRYDDQDSERTHSDFREFYWSFNYQNWTTTVGINKIFWGVTESANIVDVINQTDLVEDIDQEAKLGQPMIHFSNQQDWGKLDLFILPYFRERTFPGPGGRFSFGSTIDDAVYESSSNAKNIDLTLRYSHYIGNVDVGIYAFEGTNREPRLLPATDFNSLVPYYDQMTQIGIDLQYTIEAWLWKLESIYRRTKIDNFMAFVGGFEYTIFQINNAADLGLLLEYQYDNRNENSTITFADNDIFLAARYVLNNSQDSSILAGIVFDIQNNNRFVNIEGHHRIGENLIAELRIRTLAGGGSDEASKVFNNDDYVQFSLKWYF